MVKGAGRDMSPVAEGEAARSKSELVSTYGWVHNDYNSDRSDQVLKREGDFTMDLDADTAELKRAPPSDSSETHT